MKDDAQKTKEDHLKHQRDTEQDDYVKPKNSIERWQRLAEEGDPAAQYSLGNAYGEPGVTQNSVLAYMWLSLAARTSWFFDHAAPLRDLEGELLTSDELAEAERLVRERKPTVE